MTRRSERWLDGTMDVAGIISAVAIFGLVAACWLAR